MRPRRRHQQADVHGPRRLPRHGHFVRIAAERGDVLPHPLERRKLVHQPVIAGCVMRRFARQSGMRQESQRAQAIVDGDQHQAAPDQRALIESGGFTGTRGVGPAVNPNHHRKLRCG